MPGGMYDFAAVSPPGSEVVLTFGGVDSGTGRHRDGIDLYDRCGLVTSCSRVLLFWVEVLCCCALLRCSADGALVHMLLRGLIARSHCLHWTAGRVLRFSHTFTHALGHLATWCCISDAWLAADCQACTLHVQGVKGKPREKLILGLTLEALPPMHVYLFCSRTRGWVSGPSGAVLPRPSRGLAAAALDDHRWVDMQSAQHSTDMICKPTHRKLAAGAQLQLRWMTPGGVVFEHSTAQHSARAAVLTDHR
jgi:hypothetical protein